MARGGVHDTCVHDSPPPVASWARLLLYLASTLYYGVSFFFFLCNENRIVSFQIITDSLSGWRPVTTSWKS